MEATGGAADDFRGAFFMVRESIVSARQKFNYLSELWLLGDLDRDRYLEELTRLIYLDEDNNCWVISPENGNWYRLEGTVAVLGEPPDFLYRMVEDPGEESPVEDERTMVKGTGKAFCVHCGAPLKKKASFCNKCGRPV